MKKGGWLFKEPQNLAVFTTKQVVLERKQIIYVSHDIDDGAWQFLSEDDLKIDDAMIVSLQEVYQIDNTISDIVDLPLGWKAWRQSLEHPWQRAKNK